MEMPRAAHSTLVSDRAAENQSRQLGVAGSTHLPDSRIEDAPDILIASHPHLLRLEFSKLLPQFSRPRLREHNHQFSRRRRLDFNVLSKISCCALQASSTSNNRIARLVKFIPTLDRV